MFLGATILSSVMEGGGGIATTKLSAGIDDAVVVLPVTSTAGFLGADYVVIEDEKILYTGTTPNSFTVCTRAYDGTIAKAHSSGSNVYTAEASAVNQALGFNIAATADSMGVWAALTIPFYFLTKTIPRIIVMNFSFLSGQLALVGWFFFAMAAGLVITLAIYLAGSRRI